ncbi:hypothetical protein CROQUDRAFT_652243 [Cronartium quercuum f. sp. fusiforme G11]|uniref:Pre-mRNA-splicing factor 38 n=1 Tax=Cronartium quercuum f. sp. fusiforme G11 TaxID=708437 RepID=A0A9P6NUJ8_9BASI|nr:hypothetical protein CROQUDRAFT_652243 [Cronartium quercuum f. sp. fusiforme G11]
MANTTAKGALSIHGTNPQFLIDKVVRSRIYDSQYWKETCFALTAESVIDCAIRLKYIGGTYANVRPTEFMCLTLKLLQLQPEKEIILEYLRAEEFKYLRALAVFYVRLTFTPLNVYQTLEPLLKDYRKLRYRHMNGSYSLTTFDDFVDSLLIEDRVCEIVLPRLTMRKVLEETEGLAKRKSSLGIALGVESDEEEPDEEAEDDEDRSERYVSRSPSPASHPSPSSQRSGSPQHNSGQSERYISHSPSPERYISPSPEEERIEGDV